MTRTVILREAQVEHRVTIRDDGSVSVDGGDPIHARVEDVLGGVRLQPDQIRGLVATVSEVRVGDSPSRVAWTVTSGETRWVFLDGHVFEFEVQAKGTRRRTGAAHGSLSAPMPASVVRVDAAPGDVVRRGDALVILEAMKMELPVRAPADGTVTAVHCKPGDLVQPGVPLIEIA